MGERFIRFGWKGCPDVLGQMKDGRLLGVEVKAPDGRLRPEQALFLERIRAAGGVGFVARDCRDVRRELGGVTWTNRLLRYCARAMQELRGLYGAIGGYSYALGVDLSYCRCEALAIFERLGDAYRALGGINPPRRPDVPPSADELF